jgi:hypothetical protein
MTGGKYIMSDTILVDLSRICSIDPLSRDFDPKMTYPPSMISNCSQDYILNCRGIYYRDCFSTGNVLANRKVWIPSLPPTTLKNTPENRERLSRAKVFAAQSRNNESWCKSEYAWEADAWSQVFGKMRDDCCLSMYVQLQT